MQTSMYKKNDVHDIKKFLTEKVIDNISAMIFMGINPNYIKQYFSNISSDKILSCIHYSLKNRQEQLLDLIKESNEIHKLSSALSQKSLP